jgi:hypothetical protein
MAGKLEAIVFMLKWKTKYHGTTDILKKPKYRNFIDVQKYHNFWRPINFTDMEIRSF